MPRIVTRLATTVAAVAAALIMSAPAASAEPQPPCAADDHQCHEQQNQGAGIADQVIGNVQDGIDQAQQANDALNPKSSGLPGIMVLKNGVPWCMPLGQPIPPGAVITNIDPSGLTSYC